MRTFTRLVGIVLFTQGLSSLAAAQTENQAAPASSTPESTEAKVTSASLEPNPGNENQANANLAATSVATTPQPASARATQSSVAPAVPDASGIAMLDAYRTQSLHTRLNVWNDSPLYRGKKAVSLGYFGGNSDQIFSGSERAIDSMSTYRALRIAGLTTYLIGLGALVADIVLISTGRANRSGKQSDEPKALWWGIFAAGTAVTATGTVLLSVSPTYLSNAVDQYNDDLAERLKRGSPTSAIRAVGVSLRGRF